MGCLSAGAQEGERRLSTYVFDVNGGRQLWSERTVGASRQIERRRDLNGKSSPAETVEEKVVRSEGKVRVVERTVSRYSPDGRPLPAERAVIEEVDLGGGRKVTSTRVYRGDVNGRMDVAEIAVTETRTMGDTTETATTVERRSLNGRFEPAERRLEVTSVSGATSITNESVLEPDTNGRFRETSRLSVTKTEREGRREETRDEYRLATGDTPELVRRSVVRAVRSGEGERREVDVYGVAAPGRPVRDGLALRERQILETKAAADGSVVEVFSLQRPSLASEKELSPPQKVAETVCRGQCRDPADR